MVRSSLLNAVDSTQFRLGFLPLADLPIIRLLGGDQFRKFCVICIVVLVATVWITCACHHEEARSKTQRTQRYLSLYFFVNCFYSKPFGRSSMRDVFNNIFDALTHLPKPIRRVCYVQLFAFMGWSVSRILFHQAALTLQQVSIPVLFVCSIFFLACLSTLILSFAEQHTWVRLWHTNKRRSQILNWPPELENLRC